MKLEWKRVTAPLVGGCVCGDKTNRMFAFKKKEDKDWQSIFMCDDCAEGMAKVPQRRPGDA